MLIVLHLLPNVTLEHKTSMGTFLAIAKNTLALYYFYYYYYYFFFFCGPGSQMFVDYLKGIINSI